LIKKLLKAADLEEDTAAGDLEWEAMFFT